MSLRTRRSSQPFQRITTQALTDISSSSAATVRVIASPCDQKFSKPPMCAFLPDAQHVVHAEQAARVACQEARGAQAALGIAGAAAALVADLDALAGAGKQHRVVTDDVAAADGGKTNAGRVAWAGEALAIVVGIGSFLLIGKKDKNSEPIIGIVARSLCGIAVVPLWDVLNLSDAWR